MYAQTIEKHAMDDLLHQKNNILECSKSEWPLKKKWCSKYPNAHYKIKCTTVRSALRLHRQGKWYSKKNCRIIYYQLIDSGKYEFRPYRNLIENKQRLKLPESIWPGGRRGPAYDTQSYIWPMVFWWKNCAGYDADII